MSGAIMHAPLGVDALKVTCLPVSLGPRAHSRILHVSIGAGPSPPPRVKECRRLWRSRHAACASSGVVSLTMAAHGESTSPPRPRRLSPGWCLSPDSLPCLPESPWSRLTYPSPARPGRLLFDRSSIMITLRRAAMLRGTSISECDAVEGDVLRTPPVACMWWASSGKCGMVVDAGV